MGPVWKRVTSAVQAIDIHLIVIGLLVSFLATSFAIRWTSWWPIFLFGVFMQFPLLTRYSDDPSDRDYLMVNEALVIALGVSSAVMKVVLAA